MARLFNWDYKRPFYYMVTLKRLPDRPALSILNGDEPNGIDRNYPLTHVLEETLHTFLNRSPGIAGITPYVIMPDHIHILLKIADVPERKSLIDYVDMLKRLLRNAFQKHVGAQIPLFEAEWHDLIVKEVNQLTHFRHYIQNNPQQAILRRQHNNLFHCFRNCRHWRLGERPCDLVGNIELLDEPVFLAVRISRSVLPASAEWQRLERFYSAWRPGGTAVGTWWSKGEKMAYRKILANGGNVVVLSPDGFAERWHPGGEDAQRLCAEGRLLYVSPYPPHSAKLPMGETRRRCLALNELAHEMAVR